MVTDTMDISIDPVCGKTTDPTMHGSGHRSSPEDSMTLGDIPDLSETQIRSILAVEWPLVTIWPHVAVLTPGFLTVLGGNRDQRHLQTHRCGCGRFTDPGVVHGSNLGPDNTMSPGGKEAS